MVVLVEELVRRGHYPEKTVTGTSVLTMVENYGVYWNQWAAPHQCRNCKADLRDHEHGPPFKREIGIYDTAIDRTTYYRCPDCQGRL